jgi:hypothetical protein
MLLERLRKLLARLRRPHVSLYCDPCGHQRLQLPAVTLRECVSTGSNDVVWRCVQCGRSEATPVSSATARALRDAGVRMLSWDSVPAVPKSWRGNTELTLDDLLVWHELLSQPGWVESAARQLERPR